MTAAVATTKTAEPNDEGSGAPLHEGRVDEELSLERLIGFVPASKKCPRGTRTGPDLPGHIRIRHRPSEVVATVVEGGVQVPAARSFDLPGDVLRAMSAAVDVDRIGVVVVDLARLSRLRGIA